MRRGLFCRLKSLSLEVDRIHGDVETSKNTLEKGKKKEKKKTPISVMTRRLGVLHERE